VPRRANAIPTRTGKENVMGTLELLYAGAVILGFVIVVCWIVLPFAVIGTKPLLRQLIAELQRNNALLEQRLPDLRPHREP
jgi:hypothetical protein